MWVITHPCASPQKPDTPRPHYYEYVAAPLQDVLWIQRLSLTNSTTHRHLPITTSPNRMADSYEVQQRGIALELVTALVFRQDERVFDLCRDHLAYSAFLSPNRLPALDDLADSPAMRMKQLMGGDIDHAAHGWSPLSNTSLDELLDSRLRAYGTSNMCQQQIVGIMQRENVCAIRFREVNRTGNLDKTSVIRIKFTGTKVDAIDEYVDARKSYGFEQAVGAYGCDFDSCPSSPSSCYSV